MKRLFTHFLALIIINSGSSAIAGSIIEIKNDWPAPSVLSSLEVRDKDNDNKVFLAPFKSADDVTIPSGETRTFDAGFEIDKYTISLNENGLEFPTSVSEVTQSDPKKVDFLANPDPIGPLLSLAIDSSQYTFDPPAAGSILQFDNGHGVVPTLLPGWAVTEGSGPNGQPYTGFAQVVNSFEVTTVPEPQSFAMLLAGLGLIGVVIRGRRKHITR